MSSPPRGTLRAQNKAATHERLLDAAVRVFGRRGYQGARIDDVAAEAGASRATFYLHFPSKATLLEELLDRAARAFDPSFDDLGALLAGADEAGIAAWVVDAMGRWSEIASLVRPAFEASQGHPHLEAKLFPEVVPGAASLARVLLGAELCEDRPEAEVTAVVLLAPLQVYFRRGNVTAPDARIAAVVARNWAAHMRERP